MIDGIKRDEYNYQNLVINHLVMISNLSSSIQGESIGMGGNYVYHKEEDKLKAFQWMVKILESFIPDELRDDIFKNEMQDIDSSKETKDFYKFNMQLHCYTNLLARKGFLYKIRAIAEYSPEDDLDMDLTEQKPVNIK